MTTFRELVDAYQTSVTSSVILRASYVAQCGDENFAAMVLLHKLDKHYAAGNARSVASYLADWYQDGDFGALPERAKEIAKSLKLRRSHDNHVGYPHADGTYHWF